MRHQALYGARWTALALVLLLAWDASGLDLALAQAFGDAQGFAFRDNAFLQLVLHDGMKRLAWLLALLLCLGLGWPVGPLAALPFARRLQWVLSAAFKLAVDLEAAVDIESARKIRVRPDS